MNIKDPVLEPYYIEVEKEQYILHKVTQATRKSDDNKGNKKGDKYMHDATIGFFGGGRALEDVIRRIVHLTLSKKKKTVSLLEFLAEYRSLSTIIGKACNV